jgi:hypothetical protein
MKIASWNVNSVKARLPHRLDYPTPASLSAPGGPVVPIKLVSRYRSVGLQVIIG